MPNFCPKCGSLMFPKDGKKVCKRCDSPPKTEPVQRGPLLRKTSEDYRDYWDCYGLHFEQIDPINNKLTCCNNFPYIYYFDKYVPWKQVNNEQCPDEYKNVTNRILNLKKGYNQPKIYYSNKLKPLLERSFKSRFHICVIPSHEVNKPSQHVWDVLNECRLANNFILDDILVRTIDYGAKHTQEGARSAHNDYKSIAVNNVVQGDSYIIMDDITTSGSSMVAVATHLKEKGARQIVCLALGKTVSLDRMFVDF